MLRRPCGVAAAQRQRYQRERRDQRRSDEVRRQRGVVHERGVRDERKKEAAKELQPGCDVWRLLPSQEPRGDEADERDDRLGHRSQGAVELAVGEDHEPERSDEREHHAEVSEAVEASSDANSARTAPTHSAHCGRHSGAGCGSFHQFGTIGTEAFGGGGSVCEETLARGGTVSSGHNNSSRPARTDPGSERTAAARSSVRCCSSITRR